MALRGDDPNSVRIFRAETLPASSPQLRKLDPLSKLRRRQGGACGGHQPVFFVRRPPGVHAAAKLFFSFFIDLGPHKILRNYVAFLVDGCKNMMLDI